MEDAKQLVRMADRIKEALMAFKHIRYLELSRQLKTLTSQLQRITTESRKMGIAVAKDWFSAAQRCCMNLDNLFGDIEYCLPRIRPLTEKSLKETSTVAMLIKELDALEGEFGDIEFDASKNTISVITEPITLKDVYLGPFKIQMEINKLDHLYYNSPYYVIALEPNPAATNKSVTHPHVSDERLCEGEGSAAIKAALEEGRICDFFTIVRSILNTYSADSPYVSLDDWYDSGTCHDCGYTMSSEDSYYCEHCGHDYCPECSTFCRHCEETVCLGCSGQCSYCEDMLCRNCVSNCDGCGELFCQSCLEENLCPNCREEQENENEQQDTEINERENTSQPQTETRDIRLAS